MSAKHTPQKKRQSKQTRGKVSGDGRQMAGGVWTPKCPPKKERPTS